MELPTQTHQTYSLELRLHDWRLGICDFRTRGGWPASRPCVTLCLSQLQPARGGRANAAPCEPTSAEPCSRSLNRRVRARYRTIATTDRPLVRSQSGFGIC